MKFLTIVSLCFAFVLLAEQSIFAQPSSIHEHEYGCHFTKSKMDRIPLSEEERAWIRASKERSDTFDIEHYAIHIDLTKANLKILEGLCTVHFKPKLENLDYLTLDLEQLSVHAIWSQEDTLLFSHLGPLLKINFTQALQKDSLYTVTVKYSGTPMTSASGFGGFYFENDYAYNLGIGLQDSPHNYGRAWFPCFDNFVERSTYEISITTLSNIKSFAVGTYLGQVLEGNRLTRTYAMNQPLPTYLVGVAASDYDTYDYTYTSTIDGKEIPVQIIAKTTNLAATKNSFVNLDKAMEAFEYWYGPYIWERIGYVMVSRGAMEHSTCIAYPDFAANGTTSRDRLMAHELAHHWWGNVLTQSTSHNMWIKEGNAEYGAHLFFEFKDGPKAFYDAVESNFATVMNRAKNDDGEFLPLSPMPEYITYGVHTYNKGASSLHAMRRYLGDELFKKGQRKVLEDYEYQSIDAFQYRDKLIESTEYDLSHFFDDWIFSPGYAHFEIDSFTLRPLSNGKYRVDLFLEQKLRGRAKYMEEVPLSVLFYDSQGNLAKEQITVGGHLSTASVELNFQPLVCIPNPRTDFLPLSGFNSTMGLSDDYLGSQTRFNLMTPLPEDGSILTMEHYWVPPDPMKNTDIPVRLSKTHYWKISGHLKTTQKLRATISYNKAPTLGALDADLVSAREDSLILMYRPDAASDWLKFSHYTALKGSLSDGAGIIRIDSLLIGEYCFANGMEVPLQSNDKFAAFDNAVFRVYPNPSIQDRVTLRNMNPQTLAVLGSEQPLSYTIYSITGMPVKTGTLQPLLIEHTLEVGDLPADKYFFVIHSNQKIISALDWVKL
jgi:hypothetical protein